MERLKGYEYNKYAIKLENYLNSVSESDVDLSYCANLREKANKLRKNLSEKLYNYINTTKVISLDKIELLHKSGADLNYKFDSGFTLYMVAGLNAQVNALCYLFQNGANTLKQNDFGQDALMLVGFINNYKNNFTKNYRKIKYLPIINLIKSQGFENSMNYDNSGLTYKDYYLGETEPFTKTYINKIAKSLNINENLLTL